MSNGFKQCPTHFSRRGEKFCRGALSPAILVTGLPGIPENGGIASLPFEKGGQQGRGTCL